MPDSQWRWQDDYLIGPKTTDIKSAYTEGCPRTSLTRSRDYDPRETVMPFDGAQRLWLTRFLNCRRSAHFLDYAKHYGPLGLATRIEPPLRIGGSTMTHGESLQTWQDAHKLIATAAGLWEASAEGRAHDVEGLVSRPSRAQLILELSTAELSLCGAHRFEYSEKLPEVVGFADLVAFGRRASAALVNALLNDHSAPQVLMPVAGRAALLVTAHNKLGAMAGQLSLWMTGVNRYAVCPGCGAWNDLTTSHPSRKYCSGSRGVTCRKRHSRRDLSGRT